MARILIADDDEHIGSMVSFKLGNSGHEIVWAQNGEEAMALAERERPDLVILDVMMPGLSGFEVLARLRAHPDLRAIPVVMLTARGREQDVLAGLTGGAVDYIVKPFSLKELVVRVDSALRRSSA